MCGLLRSERTMQFRPKSKRGRRLGPAVYHPSQYLQTCIKRAPAPVTGNPNLLNNSTECFRCKPSVEFVGAPPVHCLPLASLYHIDSVKLCLVCSCIAP